MPNLVMASNTAEATAPELENVMTGFDTGLTMGGKALNFLLENQLTAFMIGIGLLYSAFGIVRKGLRTAKRT